MSNLLKNLIVALCITILLGVVYFFFFMGDSTGNEYTDETGMMDESDSEITRKTQKILADTQEIDRYSLNTAIFTDKRFLSLKDFQVELTDVATGRDNPFKPIEK